MPTQTISDMYKRIAELERELQRLREAAQGMLDAWYEGSVDDECEAAYKLVATLAQQGVDDE